MNRFRTTSAAMCLVLLAGVPALAQNDNVPAKQETTPSSQNKGDLPSLDKVFEDAIESVGGQDKIDKIKSIHTVLTMTVMGSTIKMDNKWGRDGGRFSSNESPFGNSEMGTNGEVAWMKMPGDRYVIMDEQQADQLDSQAAMHMNLLDPKRMREEMKSLEVVGREQFDNHTAYKVRFEAKGSEGTGFMYFDVRDGRPLGMMQTEDTPMGKQTTTITLGDWKTVQGVQFFHLMKIESPAMPGGSVDMKVTTLEVNTLGDDAFELPEKVKELAANQSKPDNDAESGSADAGDEISLEDLAEAHRERAKMMVDQMKSGGKEAVARMLPRLEDTLSSMPDGDDKTTLKYVIQELKKVK